MGRILLPYVLAFGVSRAYYLSAGRNRFNSRLSTTGVQSTAQAIRQGERKMDLSGYPATDNLFLKDSYLFQADATILGVVEASPGQHCVVTDRTIFHPQGGGQPADKGRIRSLQGTAFAVDMVREVGNVVAHLGKFEGEDSAEKLRPGDQVEMDVDEAFRRLCARLHSGGHAIDAAVRQAGIPGLTPVKGYHFADGPYVEYVGKVPADRDAMVAQLNEQLGDIVARALDTEVVCLPKAEAAERMGISTSELAHLPDDQDVRMVAIGGGPLVPCGGTHVKNSMDLGRMEIGKVKVKKDTVRLRYSLL